MAERTSALAGHFSPELRGKPGEPGVSLSEVSDLTLWQIAAWPETLAEISRTIENQIGASEAPGPGRCASGTRGAALRIEPLKWWLLDTPAPSVAADLGVTLDLSHSRTRIRIAGCDAAACLIRLLPLDLREAEFSPGDVASSSIHHVGVTLARGPESYDLFVPRGFALSIWELLLETAEQFGAEVV